jgi:Nucleotidyl transferase AbiEii toxin, Type IV TA system
MNQTYLDTARLLTQVAPLLFVDDTFALNGGTAINLFVRDMPRLSVDLDLVFPDHTLSRDKALARIQASLRQAADRLKKLGFQTHAPTADAGETKLLVRRGRIEIKVEVNFVMRGTVRPVRRASLTPTARDVLMADLDIPVVSPWYNLFLQPHERSHQGVSAEFQQPPIARGPLGYRRAERHRLYWSQAVPTPDAARFLVSG